MSEKRFLTSVICVQRAIGQHGRGPGLHGQDVHSGHLCICLPSMKFERRQYYLVSSIFILCKLLGWCPGIAYLDGETSVVVAACRPSPSWIHLASHQKCPFVLVFLQDIHLSHAFGSWKLSIEGDKNRWGSKSPNFGCYDRLISLLSFPPGYTQHARLLIFSSSGRELTSSFGKVIRMFYWIWRTVGYHNCFGY